MLGLKKPDFRMRDVELVVRYFAFQQFLPTYRGNLKKFLDDTCDNLNKGWHSTEPQLRDVAIQMDEVIKAAIKIFSLQHVFRKWDGEKFGEHLNRAVFDVIAKSLADPVVRSKALKNKTGVLKAFKGICLDEEFRSAIESTTKSKTAVRNRFSKWFKALGSVIGKKIPLTLPPE